MRKVHSELIFGILIFIYFIGMISVMGTIAGLILDIPTIKIISRVLTGSCGLLGVIITNLTSATKCYEPNGLEYIIGFTEIIMLIMCLIL